MLPPLTTIQMSCKHLAAAAVQALRAGIEPDNPHAQQQGVAHSDPARRAAIHLFPRGSLPALAKVKSAPRRRLIKE